MNIINFQHKKNIWLKLLYIKYTGQCMVYSRYHTMLAVNNGDDGDTDLFYEFI